ncbi:MAG: endonuclease [Pseudomonadota bacterium]
MNWKKYGCDLCLAVTLAGAAVVSTLAVAALSGAGVGVGLQAVLFLVFWGLLGWMADGYCASRAMQAAEAAAVARRETAASAVQHAPVGEVVEEVAGEDPAAVETERVAAEEAAAEKVATEKAAAEAKAAADAERAAAVKAAAEAERAAAEKAAAEKAAAEQAAPEKRAAAEALATESAAEAQVEAERAAARASSAADIDRDGDGIVEGTDEGTRPEALESPRGGVADDLKRIKGVGPKLEQVCHKLGFYHFDQIAAWSTDEVAWVDSNLEGFRGRVTRDGWVAQAKLLASGGETEFSKRVDEGIVPSSQ